MKISALRALTLDSNDAPERRRAERADLVVRVDYQTVDELFSEFARNINEGGLFVESETPHPLGTRVDLQFQLPGSDEPVQLTGSVVRTSAGSPDEPSGMGIVFDGLDSQTRQRINEMVRRLRGEGPLERNLFARRRRGRSRCCGSALAPPGAPVRGPPRNVTFCATISVVERFWPSLSSHSRVWRRPSMYTLRPFERYCAQSSPVFPQATMRCHSVRSCCSPLLFAKRSLVARVKLATAWPLCV
jgi:type IV pilus assembly protein PilZ